MYSGKNDNNGKKGQKAQEWLKRNSTTKDTKGNGRPG